MELEYNTGRPDLVLPEHGRNVKKMVNFALTVEDREERNKVVGAIIKVMGQLNPHLRDHDDYAHKLWDHIFILSDFKLDVDSPYPIPTKETFETKPERVAYPKGRSRFGHYGKVLEDLVKTIPAETDPEKQKHLVNVCANLMKRAYLAWNRDSVEDQTIVNQLNDLLAGAVKVKVEDVDLHDHKDVKSRAKENDIVKTRGRKGNSNSQKNGGGSGQKSRGSKSNNAGRNKNNNRRR